MLEDLQSAKGFVLEASSCSQLSLVVLIEVMSFVLVMSLRFMLIEDVAI